MCARHVVAVPPVRSISSPFAATLAEQQMLSAGCHGAEAVPRRRHWIRVACSL
jgi:hypothetical protein